VKEVDDRKKKIREYEDKKREALTSIEAMQETLGASILSHSEQDDDSAYCRLNRDINDSEAYIAAIEEDIVRLKALEADIQRKDQETAARVKDLSKLFTCLGEYVLEDDCIDAVRPYQTQAETVYSKIKSLEERLEQLEDRGDSNVFTWIGKNTQGMVLRSFLGKSRNSLQKIFTAAGEKYSQSVSLDTYASGRIKPLLGEIEGFNKELSVLGLAITRLKEERRRINDAFSPDGGPVKKIQTLERHIAHSREELKDVCIRYGREIETASGGEDIVPLMEEAEIQLLEDIRNRRQSIREYNREIEKLEASLAIDEEMAAVAKMEKTIKDHEARIQASGEAITNLTAQISGAKFRIEELTKVLQET
jgi:peptidoglycan hydrolase CwlO-like protein